MKKLINYKVNQISGMDGNTVMDVIEVVIPTLNKLVNLKNILKEGKVNYEFLREYDSQDLDTSLLSYLLECEQEQKDINSTIQLANFATFNNFNAKLCLVRGLRYINIVDKKINSFVEVFAPLDDNEKQDLLKDLENSISYLVYFLIYELNVEQEDEIFAQLDSFYKKENMNGNSFGKMVIQLFIENPVRFGISEDYPELWDRFISNAVDESIASDVYENMDLVTLEDIKAVASGKLILDSSFIADLEDRRGL